jgi:hypothetical protein
LLSEKEREILVSRQVKTNTDDSKEVQLTEKKRKQKLKTIVNSHMDVDFSINL